MEETDKERLERRSVSYFNLTISSPLTTEVVYDIRMPDKPNLFVMRFFGCVNTPVHAMDTEGGCS